MQRSKDGSIWNTLGNIYSPANGGTINQYTFTDSDPFIGINYYRLIQIDTDNHKTFSEIVGVNFISSYSFNVYPNPATDHVSIQFISPEKQYQLNILDMVGRVVLNTSINKLESSETILPLDNLSKGIYFIEVTSSNSGTKHIKKFIKE